MWVTDLTRENKINLGQKKKSNPPIQDETARF